MANFVLGSLVNSGLPQLPDNSVPPELQGPFTSLYNAIHNLERAISLYAGVDSQQQFAWEQLFLTQYFFDGNLNRMYLKCAEAITFGHAVSPTIVAGELQLRLANATDNTRWCCGFSSTTGTRAIGEFVEIRTRGLITGVSSLTAAARYWLSTTNGLITNTPPVAAGNIEQVVGWAHSTDRLICNLDSFFIQH